MGESLVTEAIEGVLTKVVSSLHLAVLPKISKVPAPVCPGHWLMSTRRRSMSIPLVPLIQKRLEKKGTENNMNSLEKVLAIFKAKKWNGVCHHPNVSPAAIKVGLSPGAVLIFHRKDLILDLVGMMRRVISVCVIG